MQYALQQCMILPARAVLALQETDMLDALCVSIEMLC